MHLLALSFIHDLIKMYLENIMNAVLWIGASLESSKRSIVFNGTCAI